MPVTDDSQFGGQSSTWADEQAAGGPAQPRPAKPTNPAPPGQKYQFDPASNSWQLVAMTTAELATQTVANPTRAPAPVVPYATAGASTPQPAQGTQTFATNYGGNAQGGGAGFTPQTLTAQQLSPSTGGASAGGVAPPKGGVVGSDPGYANLDTSRYDKAAALYKQSIDTFQGELARLSGVDPFGNQAFLRKATDRAVGQAAGLASGGLSTATARAGNMRQAQGVQASLASQGIEQQAVQRNADENQAAQLRLGAAGGMANVIGQQAQNEVELAKTQTQVGMANLDAYLKKYGIDAQLKQQDVENLRGVNVELQKLGEQARESDVDALLQKYGTDQNTRVALKQIAQSGKLTLKDVVGGIFTAGAGVLGNEAIMSDRRAKFDVRDPDLRDLEDFLGRTKGKLYRYRDPKSPGARAGLNYGGMAQELAQSKIGKTVVSTGPDGFLRVDTGRLALADHAALAELAREVKALKSGK